MTRVGEAHFEYVWRDRWGRLPDTPSALENGRTHGVAVTRGGEIIVFAQMNPAVLFYSGDGELLRWWGDRFLGAHGLTLIEEDGEEGLWLTDQDSGEVVKTTLDGRTLRSISPPEQEGEYAPTWVAQNPANGDVWVADGYGSALVRRYDSDGRLMATLDGTEGPGRFLRPHGLMFSPWGDLYLTDRRNQRILVYDGEGRYLRHRDEEAHSPCSFAFHDGLINVPELFGSVKILNRKLETVAELGANPEVRPPGGWVDQDGWGWPTLEGWPDLAGTEAVQPGRFNSPHDIAVGPNGEIYIVEWIVGGRITKLERQHPAG